jgi:hypothetical protein
MSLLGWEPGFFADLLFGLTQSIGEYEDIQPIS